jgi:preprotein translocase subunit YajC
MQGLLSFLMPLIILVVFFQFLIIRPQKKQKQFRDQMMNSIKIGDQVELTSGIIGVVDAMNEDAINLQTLDSKIEVKKYAVISIISTTEEE